MSDPRFVDNCCLVASAALMWFDYFLTLPSEVRGIWQRRLSGVTLTYLGIRYTLLIDRIVILLEVLWAADDKTCGVLLHFDDSLYIVNYFAVAALTTLRAYAVTALDWRALAVVLPLSLVNPIVLLSESVSYDAVQGPAPVGCTYQYTISDSVLVTLTNASMASSIAANAILILLTWWKTRHSIKLALQHNINIPVVTILVRNGTLYFLIMLLNLVLQICSLHYTSTIFVVWPYFCEAITAITLSHFILDLRALLFSHADAGETEHATSTLAFSGSPKRQKVQPTSADVVGNFGATLVDHLYYKLEKEDWDEEEEERPEFSGDPFKAGLEASLRPARAFAVGDLELQSQCGPALALPSKL